MKIKMEFDLDDENDATEFRKIKKMDEVAQALVELIEICYDNNLDISEITEKYNIIYART